VLKLQNQSREEILGLMSSSLKRGYNNIDKDGKMRMK
jgi:hypothetical protein